MKKHTFLSAAAALALMTACSGNQTSWAVNTSGADGCTVSVIDLLSGETIKSTTGDAVLKGKADKDALLAVQIDGSDWQTLFFNDGTPISVDFSDNTLKGSALNEKLNACDLELSRITIETNAEFEKILELGRDELQNHIDEIRALHERVSDGYKQMLEENADNIIPAAFMSSISSVFGEDETYEVLNSGAPYTTHPYAQKVKSRLDEEKASWEAIEAAKQAFIGKKFIDIEEPDTDGKMHKLSEYLGKGQWVFVDFWASWCGPCRAEMPNVVAAYKKYHPKGLEIVGLSFDNDKEAWVKAIKDLEMPWIHLSDLKGWQTAASEAYSIRAIPSSLLVNPDGIIVATDLRGSALAEKLAEVFGE